MFLPLIEFKAYCTMFTKNVHCLVTVMPNWGFLKLFYELVGRPQEFCYVNLP